MERVHGWDAAAEDCLRTERGEYSALKERNNNIEKGA